jgi:hypothetical protein
MLRCTIRGAEANFKNFLCSAALTYVHNDIHKENQRIGRI